jgi:hypothetical protein
MPDRLINALLAKGWGYPVIALRAKIDESRLRSGTLGRRETLRLEEMAERDAKVYLDDLEGEE